MNAWDDDSRYVPCIDSRDALNPGEGGLAAFPRLELRVVGVQWQCCVCVLAVD